MALWGRVPSLIGPFVRRRGPVPQGGERAPAGDQSDVGPPGSSSRPAGEGREPNQAGLTASSSPPICHTVCGGAISVSRRKRRHRVRL